MPELPTLVILGGGDSFDSEIEYAQSLTESPVRFFEDKTGWKTTLFRELGNRFEVLVPTLPKKDDAKYAEWELTFKKFAPNLDPKTTVYVGHSLWGIFLAKYFSENDIGARALHLVAAPFEKCGSFELGEDLSKVSKNVSNVHLWHSVNDPVVEFSDLAKYQAAWPDAQAHVFEDRRHFNGERFDELAWILMEEA